MNQWIFIFVICIVLFISLYLYFRFAKTWKKQKYELRADFFNRSEFIFYQIIKSKLPNNFMIFSKTRIEDFIRVKEGFWAKETYGLRSRIKSRHVDFLICNENGKPLVAIEIDWLSHMNLERQKRDSFVDNLYNEVWLPIHHIRVGENFEERISKIIEQIGTQTQK